MKTENLTFQQQGKNSLSVRVSSRAKREYDGSIEEN